MSDVESEQPDPIWEKKRHAEIRKRARVEAKHQKELSSELIEWKKGGLQELLTTKLKLFPTELSSVIKDYCKPPTVVTLQRKADEWYFEFEPTTPFKSLIDRYCGCRDDSGWILTFHFQDKQLDWTQHAKSMGELGFTDGATIFVKEEVDDAEDIGIFGHRADSPGDLLLHLNPSQFGHVSKFEITRLIESIPSKQMNDDINTNSSSLLPQFRENCLTPEECTTLIQYIQDRDRDHSANLFDLQITLSESELLTLLSSEKIEFLKEFFEFSVSCIRLRRVRPTETETGKNINFHRDYAQKTMQIALNDQREYDGGQLVFATLDKGLYCPFRRAGSGTVHDASIVHGVTPLKAGARYSLFFLGY